jgi:hypothetical protein
MEIMDCQVCQDRQVERESTFVYCTIHQWNCLIDWSCLCVGVFFLYDLSPIKVRFEEKQRSFAAFLTGICAIIGGIYTVSGILDSFIFVSVRSIRKKIEMGKHS